MAKRGKCNDKNQISQKEDGVVKCHRHNKKVQVKDGKCTDTNCKFSPACNGSLKGE